jgi:hypothetical protein
MFGTGAGFFSRSFFATIELSVGSRHAALGAVVGHIAMSLDELGFALFEIRRL